MSAPDMKRPFPELLRRERECRGISIHRAAKSCGVREDVYRGWEGGQGLPSKVEIRRLLGERNQLEHHLPRLQVVPSADEVAPAPVAISPEPPAVAKEIHSSFGDALRGERERARLSLDDVGALLDVSASSVRAWEIGDAAPIAEHLVKLLDLFAGLEQAPQPASKEMAKPGPARGTPPPNAAKPPSSAPVQMLDPLAAVDRVILAFDALGQPVGLAPFERGAEGWTLRLVIPGESAPLAEGSGPSLSSAALAAIGSLRAGLASRQEQTARIVQQAQARLEAQTRALAAIDGAMSGDEGGPGR